MNLLNGLANDHAHEAHKYETFCQMLAFEGYTQLRALFDAYEEPVGNSIEGLIRKEFAGDDNGEALVKLVRTIHHRATTFAANLRNYYDSEVTVSTWKFKDTVLSSHVSVLRRVEQSARCDSHGGRPL